MGMGTVRGRNKLKSKNIIGFFVVGLALVFSFNAIAEERKKIVVPRGGGAKTFLKQCATCHKGDGRGGHTEGGNAKDLRVTKLTEEELIHVITYGRLKLGMPPFDGIIQPDRIKDIAIYIKTKLKLKN